MAEEREDDAERTYTHFTDLPDFTAALQELLAIDLNVEPSTKEDQAEFRLVATKLGRILDGYLPAPGLLDPHLDAIVPPLMAKLGTCLEQLLVPDNTVSPVRLWRLGRVINWIVKVRGWKGIVPYFPSELTHILTLVALLSPSNEPSTSTCPPPPHHPKISGLEGWELRAVMLLWLTLLLTVPFNLATLAPLPSQAGAPAELDRVAKARLFPSSQCDLAPLAKQVISIAVPLLHFSGKEGPYAVLLLVRLFSRSDAVDHLPAFLDWAGHELAEGDRVTEANFVNNILHFLAAAPSIIPPATLSVLRTFMDETLLPHLRGSRTAGSSGLIRKMAVKAKGRWWMATLGKVSLEDDEPPEGLEEVLDDLMTGLSDRDTIVRYSCAKYLARMTSLLPPSLAQQIVRNTLEAFEGSEDEPVVLTSFGTVMEPGGTPSIGGTMGFGGAESIRGEARWHGVCLALAEMARRGLLSDEDVALAIPWTLKALNFDIRKASHSVGANVRDAAAYVLWSLSRACPPDVLRPYAAELATAMICEACFDREVGVRRAASAAFQEGVGRLGLYPEGIDVLAKTDFFSVSVRRMAFSISAPAVAIHKVYRDKLRDHLHHITLRHWDSAMRLQGATALRELLLIDPSDTDDSIRRELKQVASLDYSSVHGAIAALSNIALNLPSQDVRRQAIFGGLSDVRPSAVISPASGESLVAACELIANTLDTDVLKLPTFNEVFLHITGTAMRWKEPECQEAVAKTFGVLSGLGDCSKDVHLLLEGLKSPRAAQIQSAALCLGWINYALCPGVLKPALEACLGLLDPAAKADIETRRYAIRSLTRMSCQLDGVGQMLVAPNDFVRIRNALVSALSDYTTDQRGDVGSWVRAAAIEALGKVLAFAANQYKSETALSLISQAQFEDAIAGIVALAVEKLEPVRAAAAEAYRLLRLSNANAVWQWDGSAAFRLADDDDRIDFRQVDHLQWYTSAMPLLTTRYRPALMEGLVLTMGTQMESTVCLLLPKAEEAKRQAQLATRPFENFLANQSRPLREELVSSILSDIVSILGKDYSVNRIIVPTLASLVKICGMESVREVMSSSREIQIILSKAHTSAARGLVQIKSIERISGIMKFTIALLCLPIPAQPARAKAVETIALFLEHRFPRIRQMCAEQLYLALDDLPEQPTSGHAAAAGDEESQELEELLLEVEWLKLDPRSPTPGENPARAVVRLLLARL